MLARRGTRRQSRFGVICQAAGARGYGVRGRTALSRTHDHNDQEDRKVEAKARPRAGQRRGRRSRAGRRRCRNDGAAPAEDARGRRREEVRGHAGAAGARPLHRRGGGALPAVPLRARLEDPRGAHAAGAGGRGLGRAGDRQPHARPRLRDQPHARPRDGPRRDPGRRRRPRHPGRREPRRPRVVHDAVARLPTLLGRGRRLGGGLPADAGPREEGARDDGHHRARALVSEGRARAAHRARRRGRRAGSRGTRAAPGGGRPVPELPHARRRPAPAAGGHGVRGWAGSS